MSAGTFDNPILDEMMQEMDWANGQDSSVEAPPPPPPPHIMERPPIVPIVSFLPRDGKCVCVCLCGRGTLRMEPVITNGYSLDVP